MFIDASALAAILISEEDGPELLARIQNARTRITSALAVWEATVAISRRMEYAVPTAAEKIEEFLSLLGIDVVAVLPEARRIAIEAYDRFGKSRHPAGLNFGDCFAYACARHAGQPLLYKGDDFPKTDIETA